MSVRTLLSAVAACAVAVAVFLTSMSVNRHFSCLAGEEDFGLMTCDPAAESLAELSRRVSASPGDYLAWLNLAVSQLGKDPRVLDAALTMAPAHSATNFLKSGRALAEGRPKEALESLFRSVNLYAEPQSAAMLARMLATNAFPDEFRSRLQPGQRWLQPVLGALSAQKLPIVSAHSLVQLAWERQLMTDAQLQAYLSALKAAGYWVNAYSLWLPTQQQPVKLIFNGDFELPLGYGAFNWETPAGAPAQIGAKLRRRGDPTGGNVMEIEYTGRAVRAPLLRQVLVVPPGPYVLRGRYSARLKSEHGLAWTLGCLAPRPQTAGKSGALMDTQGAWRPFEAEVTIAPACGLAVQLQLERFEPYESVAGLRGVVAFDNLELSRKLP